MCFIKFNKIQLLLTVVVLRAATSTPFWCHIACGWTPLAATAGNFPSKAARYGKLEYLVRILNKLYRSSTGRGGYSVGKRLMLNHLRVRRINNKDY